MKLIGPLKKLNSQLSDPISYAIVVGDQKVELNPLIGKHIELTYLKEIFCIQCHRKTNKSFQQGYCYPCYKKLLECNMCIIHPERCNHGQVPCPDSWQHAHCGQSHIVYMANSSGLKVGITRENQVFTRWIDQGAIQGIPLYKVNNRYDSGKIEVTLKKHIADKTNWRKMLSLSIPTLDMQAAKKELLRTAAADLHELFRSGLVYDILNEQEVNLSYPILNLPKKIIASTFDKEPSVKGTLLGIKGQYLIFDDQVINIRKHAGYNISMSFE